MSDYFRVGRGLDSSAVSYEVEPGPDASISLLSAYSVSGITSQRNGEVNTLGLSAFAFYFFSSLL